MSGEGKKILILGAGPCGLGAAYRLKELGHTSFKLYEAQGFAGGLATSFVDEKGFTWDIGGHVQFSHYEEFDRVMDEALGKEGWLHHQRESWVWIFNRFTPYPFQKNLWRLPEQVQVSCLQGLEKISKRQEAPPENFRDWILQSFGEAIAEHFMFPYNFKVWAFPPEMMDYRWIGERVATVDVEEIRKNTEAKKDDVSWGPNSTFRFPKRGGTGAIWKRVAKLVGEDRIQYNRRAIKIDPSEKIVFFQDGSKESYDVLLSTLPIDDLARLCGESLSHELLYSSSHIVGIGLRGQAPESLQTKCWMYFPEQDCPFYRVTVFSNYSPYNVPEPGKQWSLMCETSESSFKPVQAETLLEETIKGLKNTKMISNSDEIVSTWYFKANKGYPTPSLTRDKILAKANEVFEKREIYSRGRFGQWRYEISNQDHTFMQGWEWAEKIELGREEKTLCRS